MLNDSFVAHLRSCADGPVAFGVMCRVTVLLCCVTVLVTVLMCRVMVLLCL